MNNLRQRGTISFASTLLTSDLIRRARVPTNLALVLSGRRGGPMVSALDSGASAPVRTLAGDIVLCSWARHFTLTVPLSSQVYKWVPANLMLGVTLRWTSIPSRGIEILPVASCYRNRDKLRPDGPIGPNADFTYLTFE